MASVGGGAMTFGRLTADPDDAQPDRGLVEKSKYPALILLAVILATLVLWAIWPKDIDHRASLAEAAARLGVTDEVRASLRNDLQKTIGYLGGDLCDESLRDQVGRAAVAYYETLLEKPVMEAGLEMTYDSRCMPRISLGTHPFEALRSRGGLGGNLTLPWNCLPEKWRTPTDRALQARLEQLIKSGHITSESLTGTLAVIARPTRVSPLRGLCRRPTHEVSRSRPLPLNYVPPDDWDRAHRRRRRY